MMSDWFRSLTVLGIGFVGVVAFTLGLAVIIVPGPAVSSQASDPTPSDPPATDAIVAVPTQVGGTLTVSGDVEGTFALTAETTEGRYGLEGDDARVYFALTADPPAIEQLGLGTLSFFPEPDECTITPGVLNPAIGVAAAELHCARIADVRDTGVVTISGTIGLAGDVLDMRGDLPATGGSVEVGNETLVFTGARLFVGEQSYISSEVFTQRITTSDDDGESESWLVFDYDPDTGELTLGGAILDARLDGTVLDDSTVVHMGNDGCPISTREIGPLNPRVMLVELSFDCPEVNVDELGLVSISGSLIVEQSDMVP